MSKSDNYEGISNEAVLKATKKTWDEWGKLLDESGGKKLNHRELVQIVTDTGLVSPWWAQMVTVGYEKSRGLRVLGQTADAGYQIGVQKTINLPADILWKEMLLGSLLPIWLNDSSNFKPEVGYKFIAGSISGEVRTLDERKKIRMRYQDAKNQKPTTLQLYFMPSGQDKTSLRFHQEKLASQKERQRMKEYWQEVCAKIEATL